MHVEVYLLQLAGGGMISPYARELPKNTIEQHMLGSGGP